MKIAHKSTSTITVAIGIIATLGLSYLYTHTLEQSVVIGFTGDVMLGRLVNEKIKQTSFSYPWGNMLSAMHQTDFNIINLETTLTRSSKKIPKTFNYKADPCVVKTLVAGNVKVANLANNHMLDFDVEGLQETIDTLDQAQIHYVGAGMNISQAQAPIVLERHGIKIGVLGFTDNEPSWAADATKPGINYFSVDHPQPVFDAVQKLSQEVNIVIVSLHWGGNWPEQPSKKFKNFAHGLLATGADIVHGHSAHIFQGIERVDNKLIMYSTGDFVDDYAVDPKLRNDLSFFFMVQVDKHGVKNVRLIPTQISNMQVNRAPADQAQKSFERMRILSEQL